MVSALLNDSIKCEKQVKLLRRALEASEEWAVKFLDTWGFPSGTKHGTEFSEGHFTECVNFQHEDLRGKYCTAKLKARGLTRLPVYDGTNFGKFFFQMMPKESEEVKNGFCVPTSCTAKQITKLSSKLLKQSLHSVKCYQPPTIDGFDSFAIAVLITLSLFTLFCTVYDGWMRKKGRAPSKAVEAFSVHSNFENLTQVHNAGSTIRSIDGIKVLSAMWIIIGHRKDFMNEPFPHRRHQNNWLEELVFDFFSSYLYCVDTFFACSAILVTQSLLRSFDKGQFNIFKAYTNRFLRFFPSVAVLVMFFSSSLPRLMIDGPLFSKLSHKIGVCKTWGWSCLLFIQNYINYRDNCLNHTWYLATDLQLFIISPFFVYILWMFGRRFLKVIIFTIIGLQCMTFVRLYKQNLDPVQWYKQTQYRLAEYLVGVITGYLLYTNKGRQSKHTRFKISVGWTLSVGFLSSHIFYQLKPGHSPTARHFYDAFHREAWAASICWIVYACQQFKSGGPLRTFLSHSLFQPLSKICLSVYLVHYIYIVLTHLNQKKLQWVGVWWLIHINLADILISFALGAIFFFAVEAPTAHVVKSLWTNKTRLEIK